MVEKNDLSKSTRFGHKVRAIRIPRDAFSGVAQGDRFEHALVGVRSATCIVHKDLTSYDKLGEAILHTNRTQTASQAKHNNNN